MKRCKTILALLLVLGMVFPLFGISAAAVDADSEVPIDYRFEEVTEKDVPMYAEKLSSDPFSPLQWGMKMVGMERAWNSGLTGKGVVVAIVDSGLSGITMDIPKGRMMEGVNLSPIRLNIGSPVLDTVGHGTFIAGIIGATKGNGISIAGIAPEVTFAPVKCFSSLFTTPDAEVNGVYAAVDDFHCDVINLSSGAPENLPALHKAVQYAVSKGVIVVSTVGNDGNDVLNYPGAYDEVIAVGSVNKDLQVSDFSQRNESVFVVAPGEDVYSLGTTPFRVYKSSGTSFSAPFVSGLAALLKEQYPQMNQSDFMEILKRSARDLGEPGWDSESGYGLLQVPEAIIAAAEYFGGTAPEMPETPIPESLISRLLDVLQNSWFYNAVKYVTDRQYMNGMSENTFVPNGLVTRGQLAQILYNMEGRPAVQANGVFRDVQQSAWFFSPVVWAERMGLVSGFPDGSFQPNAPVTREQMAAILQRYAQWKGLDFALQGGDAGRFADFGAVSDWAKAAMQWAVSAGVFHGDNAHRLNPQSSATRAEIAAMLMNFDSSMK